MSSLCNEFCLLQGRCSGFAGGRWWEWAVFFSVVGLDLGAECAWAGTCWAQETGQPVCAAGGGPGCITFAAEKETFCLPGFARVRLARASSSRRT